MKIEANNLYISRHFKIRGLDSKICVIGCGWLGFPLAKKLIEYGYDIHGSTTSKDKIELLENADIHPFIVHFSAEGIVGNIKDSLANCQTLIVNIPPGLRKHPEHDYVQKMTHLANALEESSISHVLFIGSTSVYDDDETIPVITERSPTSNSEIALQLLEVEAIFQKHKKFKTTVLRFSGLFAEDRHPAKFLSGKTALKNPNAPVNLIHRNDCIDIILQIIKQDVWDEIFNASTSGHPTKKNYYTSICKMLQIPIPEFENNTLSKGKVIDSTKLVQLLNYDFKVKL
jgi:nucleoside-diphosphate-sugar epimerase